jgi:hypothetical protein
MQTWILATLILVTASVRALAASDDLTVVSKNTLNGKDSGNSTSYLSSDHVRMAHGDGNEMIVDIKSGVMTTLDNKKRTYYTMTQEDLQQMGAKMQAMMNDPEMKKGMEMMQKLSGAMAQSYEVKDTGVSRNIAGFQCEDWTISMAGISTMHECVTTALKYPVHAFDAYKAFSQSLQASMGAMGPMAKAGADLAEKLKKMQGFPIASSMTMEIMGTNSSSGSEVIEVRRGSIPDSVWEIPAGYKQVENPMLKAFDKHGRGRPSD